MKRFVVHVVPGKGRDTDGTRRRWWEIRVVGARTEKEKARARRAGEIIYEKQIDAMRYGRVFARAHEPSQLVLHGRSGKILWERTYPRSSDPIRFPG